MDSTVPNLGPCKSPSNDGLPRFASEVHNRVHATQLHGVNRAFGRVPANVMLCVAQRPADDSPREMPASFPAPTNAVPIRPVEPVTATIMGLVSR